MAFLDIIFVIPLIVGIYKGYTTGLIVTVFTLLAFLVAIYAGMHFSDGTANFLKENWSFDSEYVPTIAFTVTCLLVGAMVYFGGKMLEKMVDIVHLSPLNKVGGAVLGLVKALYILSVALVLLESYDEKGEFMAQETKDNSLLYEPVKNLSLKTIPQLKESSIFLVNAFKAERDSTGLTVEQILRAKETADSLGINAENAQEIKRIHETYNH